MTIHELKKEIEQLVLSVITTSYGITDPDIHIGFPPPQIESDYSVACFALAKQLKQAPPVIAKTIAEKIPVSQWISSVTAAGPYLNFSLSPEALFGITLTQAQHEYRSFGHTQSKPDNRILLEYSSPNTNKPLHLGHVRNNTLGVALTNILRAAGNEVMTACIFNDRGIHICKAMLAYALRGEGKTPESTGIKGDHFVGDFYVLFDEMNQENPTYLEQAHNMLQKWEQGDPETRVLWKKLNQWALAGMWETYRRMGCSFDLEQNESDTYLLGRDIVLKGLEQGIFYQEPDNSVWIDLTDIGLDKKVLLRSDGTSVYATQDLGTAVERFNRFNLNRALYVVASEQIYHFQVLFELFKRLGYPWAGACEHYSYGMVNLPEGKMKSRKGTVVDADDLLDEMKALAITVMEESGIHVEDSEREQIGEIIAQGAVKFFILKVSPKKDITFDPKSSLAFEGATGTYLQYTHARICSIFRKAGVEQVSEFDPAKLSNPEEVRLARYILRFPDVITGSAEELNPTKLAYYLLDLAKSFSQFYTQHQVLFSDSPERTQARLALCNAVRIVIRNGLALLGIDVPERM